MKKADTVTREAAEKDGGKVKGTVISDEDVLAMVCDVGFVKGFMEILYGCLASPAGEDEITGDLLYLIGEARNRLSKTMEVLERAEEEEAAITA